MQIIESTEFGVRAAVYRMRHRPGPLQFTLFPMLHVGKPEYYAEVKRRLAEADVIIAEGVYSEEPEPASPPPDATVWDRVRDPGLRADLFAAMLTSSYRAIPSDQQHGLVVQPDDLEDVGVEVIRPDVSTREVSENFRTTASPWRNAALLATVGATALAQRLIGPRMTRYQLRHATIDDEPAPGEILAPAQVEHLLQTLVFHRDKPLLAAVDQLIETRGGQDITVAVVYGALHMRAVLDHLFEKGFRVNQAEWITVTPWI